MLLFYPCVLRLKRAGDVLANHKCTPNILEYKSRLKRTRNITPLPTATTEAQWSWGHACFYVAVFIYWFIALRSAEWLRSSILVLETDLGPEIGLKSTFTWFFGFILGSWWDTAPPGGFLVPVTVVLPLRHSHVAAHRREVSSLSHSSHWVSCPECGQKIHRRTKAPPTPSPRWLIPLESLIRNGGNGSFHCEESTHLEGKRSSLSLSEMNVFVCRATGNNSDLFVRSSTSKGGKWGAALTQETETYFPSGKIQPFTGLTCSYKYS